MDTRTLLARSFRFCSYNIVVKSVSGCGKSNARWAERKDESHTMRTHMGKAYCKEHCNPAHSADNPTVKIKAPFKPTRATKLKGDCGIRKRKARVQIRASVIAGKKQKLPIVYLPLLLCDLNQYELRILYVCEKRTQ